MKARLANYTKNPKIIIILIIVPIITVFSFACVKESNSNAVICNQDDYSLYPKVVEQILPSYLVEQSENKPYYILNDGATAEVFDMQAVGAIETGIAKYWYPQYLATVIIAIDRDQTNIPVTSWSDLFDSQQEVGLFDTPENMQMLIAAMSYGLEGEQYSLAKTTELLTLLYDNNRLKINTSDSPIIICYDYQAASFIENGRNIEIVVPTEGTYTYEKGLLSNENLDFQGNVDELLLGANLRLLDGQSKLFAYPDETYYGFAVKVSDYKHFAKTTKNIRPIIERRILKTKKFMSIDYREHLYFALIYMSVVTIWTALILKRSMQKGVSYSAFFTGLILNGWALVRLIKYQVVANESLTRYLWYSYYIFQLSLPLVILWMAWAIDKPKNKTFPPKWWRRMAILIGILIVFVFTNDLHGLVFQLDLSRPDWGSEYTYGFGYYIIFFICMMNITIAFAILTKKSMNSPRKKAFFFPLGMFFLFIIYNYKYITRDSFAYETDITIVTGIFAMLMFEACIHSGLIPVNTKYIDIFTRSPLKIQILNKDREVAIASSLAVPINKEIIENVIASSPAPVLQEDESLLFANSIPGGYALWSEDISKIKQLHREIQNTSKKLIEANLMLSEEEKIKRAINEKDAKIELMGQLELEISESIDKLLSMIDKLEYSENHSMASTRIALLLCYIKRRCNLFFKEKKTNTAEIDLLIMYLDELSEIARYSNLQIVTTNEIKGNLSVRYVTLFYDFFYTLVDLAVQKSCSYIIVDIIIEGELIIMKLLPSVDIGELKTDSKLAQAIAVEKGQILRKDLEDTIGINISFPKGGVGND